MSLEFRGFVRLTSFPRDGDSVPSSSQFVSKRREVHIFWAVRLRQSAKILRTDWSIRKPSVRETWKCDWPEL